MKNLIFIISIIIILFKTGNVLSENNIFNVNNIEINEKKSLNKDKLANRAFKEAFDQLIYRLLLKEDYEKVSGTNLNVIKNLVSYYQILDPEDSNDNNKVKFQIFFDKRRMHDFFYQKNILYSDIINTEVIIFPLLKKEKKFYVYSKNYFFDNWIKISSNDLIQFSLPVANIENIQKINQAKENIYKLDISEFFKEYKKNNLVFVNIDVEDKKAKIFLSSRIGGKKIKKTSSILKINDTDESEFNNEVILHTNNIIRDIIKSQNLIDVRTPSFLNVQIKLDKESNFVNFTEKMKNIDLVENYYVQQLNKDYVMIKIKYLGKINKIIEKLKEQNIDLKMTGGQWVLRII